MKIFTLLFILCCCSFFELKAQTNLGQHTKQGPYIEDSRAVKLIGRQLPQPIPEHYEENGKTYQCFASKDDALDYFKAMDAQFDYMEVVVNAPTQSEELYEIQRQILRHAYYDTDMEKEIFSILKVE
jgi:hypothetical protein